MISHLLSSRPATDRVRNVEAAVERSLEGTKNACAGRSCLETNIKTYFESALLALHILCEEVLAVDLLLTLVHLVETKELQSATREQETSGIGSSPILQAKAARQTILHQLLGMSLRKDLVSLDGGVSNLSKHVAIRDPNDQAILGSAANQQTK